MTAGSDDGWYTFRSEEQRGPLPFEQLSRDAAAGILLKSDFVWRKGFEEWQPAASIAGLFPSAEEISATPGVPPNDQPGASASQVLTDPAKAGSAPDSRKQGTYFARHWRGELSLPVAYWVNGILGNIAVVAVSFTVPPLLIGDGGSPIGSFSAVTVFIVSVLAISMWQFVGIWRSANEHPKRGGRRFWAGAAQCMVVVGAFRIAIEMGQGVGPLWVETAKVAIGGDTEFGAAKITALRGGTEIAFDGGINHGALDELTRILDATPNVKTIHLTSGGGRIAEGRRIASEIARRGLDTYVHTECSSACTVAFLGGKKRWLAKDAKLGFHAPDIPGVTGELHASLVADEEQALMKSGLPSWFVSRALSTPPDDMWYPTATELQTANVITGIADPDDFAAPGSMARATQQDVLDELLKFPSYSAIKEIDPAAFDRLANAMHASSRQGKSVGEITSEARALVTATVGEHAWKISDQAAARYLDRMHRQLMRLSVGSPKDCAAMLRSKSMAWPADLETRFPEEFAGEHEFMAELLLSTKGAQEQRLSEAEVNALFDKAMKGLNAEMLFFPEEKQTLGYSDYVPFCASTIAILEGALSLPQAQQADFARYMIASE